MKNTFNFTLSLVISQFSSLNLTSKMTFTLFTQIDSENWRTDKEFSLIVGKKDQP